MLSAVRRARHLLRKTAISGYNAIRTNDFAPVFYDDALRIAFPEGRPPESDISDHLPTIFADIVGAQPRLIVELGTRGGESTKTILGAAAHSDARVLSIDIDDCKGVAVADSLKARWEFIQADDVAFGRERFREWCAAKGIAPSIDVLFIDTSHLYEHTVAEIAQWEGFVPEGGIILFHDTNLRRTARTVGNKLLDFGWDNERGVIRAIEEFLGRRYDEGAFFVDTRKGWLVRHHPNNYGLTLLRRLPATSPAGREPAHSRT